MSVFGDMKEITCNHLGNDYRFYPKANESFTIDKGGIRNNDDANQVTTNGILMVQKNTTRGMIEGPVSSEDDTETNLNILSKSPIPGNWTFVSISGKVYKSLRGGVVVGDIQSDSNAGTITLKVAAAEFEEISA